MTLPEVRESRERYLIISILFAVSCFSFGDRVALSLAGAAMGETINFTPVRLGYLFSAFSWAYVLTQLPPVVYSTTSDLEESMAPVSSYGLSAASIRGSPAT